VPLRLNHNPPEAKNWLIIINLAPPVPRKVMVSAEGLLPFMANKIIGYPDIF
jgi:hypothetical protein